ncbi:MAG: right-handed parallel beta-helix repeat-containing protein [bacterium]
MKDSDLMRIQTNILRLAVCLAWLIGVGMCSVSVTASNDGLTLYVSPYGTDDWSGKVADPIPSGGDGPFATIERARDAIREIRSKGTVSGDITVQIREGTYRIQEPVQFTQEDCGDENLRITYAAYPGERPAISGGRLIEGWYAKDVDGKALWCADVPDVKQGKWWFRELFVNGERRPRTRLPKTGYYQFTGLVDLVEKPGWSNGVMAAMFSEGDLKYWKNLGDVEIVALTRWIESRSPIAGIDADNHIVTFAKKSTFRLENTKKGEKFARYYVENVFEALEEPGQWYLDRPQGVLYYLPRADEKIDSIQVEAPILTQLIQVKGGESNEHKARNLHFKNLIFQHAEWEYPSQKAGSVQAAYEVPGAIYLEEAENCSILECTIEQLGTYGIELGKNCRNMEIRRCAIQDLGGGGIKVGHGSSHATVADNEIAHCGRIYHSAIGVWVGNSGNNSIVHNHIHDQFYTGISVGWSWGYNPTQSTNNEVAYNYIHQIGQGVLSDMGAIYTLGVADGSRIHHNRIHDVHCHGFGGWGIYLDEGTTHMLVENNLVYRAESGGFHIHYGKENTIRNNIFAFATTNQIQRSRDEEHKSFDFINNIVCFTEGTLLGGTWKNNQFYMNKNLYWNPNSPQIEFPCGTFKEWKALGHDVKSRIADPRFVNPDADDFTLLSRSPAFKMGFKPIDLSAIGPRP